MDDEKAESLMSKITLNYVREFNERLEATLVKNISEFEGREMSVKTIDPKDCLQKNDVANNMRYYFYKNVLLVVADLNLVDENGTLRGYIIRSRF